MGLSDVIHFLSALAIRAVVEVVAFAVVWVAFLWIGVLVFDGFPWLFRGRRSEVAAPRRPTAVRFYLHQQ